jgi:hypothetical protein
MIRPILNLRMEGDATIPSGATFTAAAGSTLDFSEATVYMPNAYNIVRFHAINQADRYALTTAEVQNGDYVYQTDTGVLYEVTDETALSGAGGYTALATVSVSQITGLGANVGNALAVAVGNAGAFLTFNGALGTPSSGTLTNCTLPVSGITGLGANVGTFLATPSSANLLAAVTDETGTGALVFGTSPTFTTSVLIPDGAAATPALRFASDTDTGMYLYGANKIGWSANSNVRMSMEPGILRLGASMTATCSAGSYLLIEAADSAGICLSRTTATTGKYSFFTKGTGDFGFFDELNARYCINIIKASGLVEAPLGLSSGGTLGVTGATTLTGLLTANGGITLGDAQNIAFNTTTGTKIGAATTQKLSFWNATPIVQPTTAVASATVAHTGGGTNIKTDDTFDGYTIAQVVKALRNAGLLA